MSDRHVAVAHPRGYVIEGLVRHLHVVAPQGGGRTQQGDVGGGYRTEIKRCVIGRLIGHLTAPPGGSEEDTGEHGDDRDYQYNGHIRIVPRSTRDVASIGGLRRNRRPRGGIPR